MLNTLRTSPYHHWRDLSICVIALVKSISFSCLWAWLQLFAYLVIFRECANVTKNLIPEKHKYRTLLYSPVHRTLAFLVGSTDKKEGDRRKKT